MSTFSSHNNTSREILVFKIACKTKAPAKSSNEDPTGEDMVMGTVGANLCRGVTERVERLQNAARVLLQEVTA